MGVALIPLDICTIPCYRTRSKSKQNHFLVQLDFNKHFDRFFDRVGIWKPKLLMAKLRLLVRH